QERRSMESGYRGLRATGDMAWLETRDWPDFLVYEAAVNRVFPQHRMVGLCTYSLDGCSADVVLEVIRNHQVALSRIPGDWGMIENSSFKVAQGALRASEQLQRLSADVLQHQDEERRWIANQLHEVTAQNVSAIAIYLASLQQGKSWPSAIKFILEKCHALCEQTMQQVLTLSRLLHPPILDELGLAACLRAHIEDFMRRNRIHVEFETGPEVERLPLEMETHL